MPDKNKKSKSGIFAGVAILVVALLILSSIFVYYEYFAEEEIQEIKEEFKIDDRISPLENQGVVIEVLRIRHRGLYDKLTKTRRGWKANPTFLFVANMDGRE